MPAELVSCPSCGGDIGLSERTVVTICPQCNAVLRKSWAPAGASAAVRPKRRQTEQVLEDLRVQRKQLEKDIGRHSFLYGFMGVTALSALLWGWFGWARTILALTMRPSADDMVAVILFLLFIALPLLVRQAFRASAKAKLAPQFGELDGMVVIDRPIVIHA